MSFVIFALQNVPDEDSVYSEDVIFLSSDESEEIHPDQTKSKAFVNGIRKIDIRFGRSDFTVCTLCGVRMHRSTLHEHERSHHDPRAFSCSICDVKFLLMSRCVRHLMTDHGIHSQQWKFVLSSQNGDGH